MKKIKHLLSFSALGAFLVLFSASEANKHTAVSSESVKTPSYDYVPAESQMKTGITLALVKPSFAKAMINSNCQIFKDFSDHMATDFEEMVTKRGYTLRGPFQQADDMVYDDKLTCYLYLQPEILIQYDLSNLNVVDQSTSHFVYGRGIVKEFACSYEGSITISGQINMIFAEPFSREKIKTLSISVPQKVVLIKNSLVYRKNDFREVLLRHNDAGIINPIIDALEDCYQSCFATAYNHLEPQEILLYVADAKKARESHK